MNRKRIIPGSELKEILREQLKRALLAEAVSMSEDTEYYLFNLLSDYRSAERAQEISDLDEPIGVRLMEAMSAGSPEKAKALREIGDTTLMALGFFADSLRRSIVDRSYYISIGGCAYETLSCVVVCDPQFAEVYTELAIKFASLADVLARIAPWNRGNSD